MGGRGMGATVSGRRSEYTARAVVSYNPDAKSRPYSIAEAYDVGGASWGTDARQRPRTFATQAAAEEYIRRSASGPVQIDHVARGGSYPDRDQMRAAADRAGPEVRAALEGIWERQAEQDRAHRARKSNGSD